MTGFVCLGGDVFVNPAHVTSVCPNIAAPEWTVVASYGSQVTTRLTPAAVVALLSEFAPASPSGSGGAVSPPTPPSPAGASGDNSSVDGAP